MDASVIFGSAILIAALINVSMMIKAAKDNS